MSYRFPFGEPVRAVQQFDRSPKRVFVLGVYASAVHARWSLPHGGSVRALAVASEPSIFWNGEGATEIISRLDVPEEAGRLSDPGEMYNGPSGRSLDDQYLAPLDLSRANCWLCDLLPEHRVNPRQAQRIEQYYSPLVARGIVPATNVPWVQKSGFADEARREEIAQELIVSGAEVLITLGDLPLREFAEPLGIGPARLNVFGTTPDLYGRLHDIELGARKMRLLPLVHPRQAKKLGRSSARWTSLHRHWISAVAPSLRAEVN